MRLRLALICGRLIAAPRPSVCRGPPDGVLPHACRAPGSRQRATDEEVCQQKGPMGGTLSKSLATCQSQKLVPDRLDEGILGSDVLEHLDQRVHDSSDCMMSPETSFLPRCLLRACRTMLRWVCVRTRCGHQSPLQPVTVVMLHRVSQDRRLVVASNVDLPASGV